MDNMDQPSDIDTRNTQINEMLGKPSSKWWKYGNYALCAFTFALLTGLCLIKYPLSVGEPVLITCDSPDSPAGASQPSGMVMMEPRYAGEIAENDWVTVVLDGLPRTEIKGYVESIAYDQSDTRYRIKIAFPEFPVAAGLSAGDRLTGTARIIVRRQSILPLFE